MKKEQEFEIVPNLIALYELMGENSLDYKSAIAELNDNCYSAVNGDSVDVNITLRANWTGASFDLKTASLYIEDNGKGILPEDLPKVVEPANKTLSKGTLNMFGAGWKNAAMSLGCTRTKDSIFAFELVSKTSAGTYMLDRLSSKVLVKPCDRSFKLKSETGTIVKISDLRNFPNTQHELKKLIWHLETRYQNYLENDPSKHHRMNITISYEQLDGTPVVDNNKQPCVYKLKAGKPLFSESNAPERKTVTETGGAYQATLVKNYRPSSHEIETYADGKKEEDQFSTRLHPYYYHKRIVDFIYRGLVIWQTRLEDVIGILPQSNDSSNRAEWIHLTVYLERGFELVSTKNQLKQTGNYESLKEEIKTFLGKKLTKSEVQSEKHIKDKLEKMWGKTIGAKNVTREVTELYGLRPDFKLNGTTVVEVKKDEANTSDVIQAINYAIINNFSDVKLIANGFTANAQNCAKEYLPKLIQAVKTNLKLDVTVTLDELSDYNIGGKVTD